MFASNFIHSFHFSIGTFLNSNLFGIVVHLTKLSQVNLKRFVKGKLVSLIK